MSPVAIVVQDWVHLYRMVSITDSTLGASSRWMRLCGSRLSALRWASSNPRPLCKQAPAIVLCKVSSLPSTSHATLTYIHEQSSGTPPRVHPFRALLVLLIGESTKVASWPIRWWEKRERGSDEEKWERGRGQKSKTKIKKKIGEEKNRIWYRYRIATHPSWMGAPTTQGGHAEVWYKYHFIIYYS